MTLRSVLTSRDNKCRFWQIYVEAIFSILIIKSENNTSTHKYSGNYFQQSIDNRSKGRIKQERKSMRVELVSSTLIELTIIIR